MSSPQRRNDGIFLSLLSLLFQTYLFSSLFLIRFCSSQGGQADFLQTLNHWAVSDKENFNSGNDKWRFSGISWNIPLQFNGRFELKTVINAISAKFSKRHQLKIKTTRILRHDINFLVDWKLAKVVLKSWSPSLCCIYLNILIVLLASIGTCVVISVWLTVIGHDF